MSLFEEIGRPVDWTDNDHVLVESGPTSSWGLWQVAVEGDERQPLAADSFQRDSALSPDGRYRAFVNTAGAPLAYVTPFSGPGRSWQISDKVLDSQGRPIFWVSEDEILFRGQNRELWRVEVDASGDELSILSNAERVFPNDSLEVWDVSRDGQTFLVASRLASRADATIAVVLNWTEELDQD